MGEVFAVDWERGGILSVKQSCCGSGADLQQLEACLGVLFMGKVFFHEVYLFHPEALAVEVIQGTGIGGEGVM